MPRLTLLDDDTAVQTLDKCAPQAGSPAQEKYATLQPDTSRTSPQGFDLGLQRAVVVDHGRHTGGFGESRLQVVIPPVLRKIGRGVSRTISNDAGNTTPHGNQTVIAACQQTLEQVCCRHS